MKARLVLLACTVVVAGVSGQEPTSEDPLAVDPDDLAALLADLEAQGGVLDPDELAWLVGTAGVQPAAERTGTIRPSRRGRSIGELLVGADGRDGMAPRLDARARLEPVHPLQLAMRWRRDPAGEVAAVWAVATGPSWRLAGGTGSLGHGFGLVAAGLGARSSLDVDASLLPSASAGWRPSLTITAPERLQAIVLEAAPGPLAVTVGVARDPLQQPARHVRLGLGHAGRSSLGVVLRDHDGSRAAGLDLRLVQGPWRLVTEVATWRPAPDQPPGQAMAVAAAWNRRTWRAEVQAAASRAATAMAGAQRPASLTGWDGQGWAWRVVGRPVAGAQVRLLAATGDDRRAEVATGRQRTRHVLGAAVGGAWPGGAGAAGSWELRWRRVDEVQQAWDPTQPWLPAALDSRRSRTWLTLRLDHAIGGGTGQVSWRRLEEAGQARDLVGVRWQRRFPTWRWRAGWQTAWGEPLDLVTVSVPVSSMMRPRHWGGWDSSLWAGCEGTGRWRWQVGGELRWRSLAAGGGMVGEARAQWGRVF